MEPAEAPGVSLVGPGGLVGRLTKTVLETALEAKLTERLGHGDGGIPSGPIKARRVSQAQPFEESEQGRCFLGLDGLRPGRTGFGVEEPADA